MRLYGDWQQRLGKQLQQRSILDRVLIDTSMVIIVGAVGGPLLTRHLSHLSPQADLWLMLFFARPGIVLGLITDYLIVKTTLRSITVFTKSLSAPSSARLRRRNAAGDGGLSTTRHKTRQVSMDYMRTVAPHGQFDRAGRIGGRHDPGAVAAGTRHLPGSDPAAGRTGSGS